VPEQDGRSVLFVTLDSCRYDTYVAAELTHLSRIGSAHRAMAPATFTYASHAAMFVGFTPGDSERREPFVNPKVGKIFKIVNSGANPKGTEHFTLEGQTIIEGFKRKGYATIGTGAMQWFNPKLATSRALIQDFDRFYYPEREQSIAQQVAWLQSELQQLALQPATQPVFAFVNVGETHVPYYYQGAPWEVTDNPCRPFDSNGRNSPDVCRYRQRKCLEFVDGMLAPLLQAFARSTIVVCGDHGDAWGEDGLWEHGIYHPKVLEVPLLFHLGSAG
jgi:arylsulfatase A-like enzyme